MADAVQPNPDQGLPANQVEALQGLTENLIPPDQLNEFMNGLLGILQPNSPGQDPPPNPGQDEDNESAQEESDADEKKKLKLAKFAEDLKAPNQLRTLYPRYTMERLRKRKYVKLWYFTPEGRNEERSIFVSSTDNTLGLARVGGQVTLKPFSSIQPSKKAVSDKELTWLSFTMVYPNLIAAMHDIAWEPAYVNALGDFFLALAHHELTFQPDGFDALFLYQVEVCLSWHNSLRHKRTTFNIANINDKLLWIHLQRVQDSALYCLRTQVCKLFVMLMS